MGPPDARLVCLVTLDLALLDAAIEGRPALEQALGCDVAEGWDVFGQSLARIRDAVAADPASTRWGARLFLLDTPRALVGWGGFKGPPRDGVVELGYAISPTWEGRGIATAAVGELLRDAYTAPDVRSVIAHTLPETGPSVRVLGKAGFRYESAVVTDGVGTTWRFRHDRDAAGDRIGVAAWGPTSRHAPQRTRPGATPTKTLGRRGQTRFRS
jgi:RimJ/RimL family protein N-acetyltransferase